MVYLCLAPPGLCQVLRFAGVRFTFTGAGLLVLLCLKQIFLDTTQIGDTKTLGWHFPRMPPMATGLGATLSICAFVVFIPVWKYLGNRPTALFQITSKLPQYG